MPNEDPNQKTAARKGPEGALGGLMRAERLMEIALILPIAVLVGWAIGAGLDKWLHRHWIYIPGVLLGAVAGFVEVFRIIQRNSGDDQ